MHRKEAHAFLPNKITQIIAIDPDIVLGHTRINLASVKLMAIQLN